MDPVDLKPDLEDLEENIDDLEEALDPLLKTPIVDIASKLPLLDKAKLYVLAAYAIESVLFSTLQVNGTNAKEHAVFTELARLKQYFAKIKEAETPPKPRTLQLDKGAAARFIKHGLAGNDKYDADRAERIAAEKARAEVKARGLVKFDDATETAKQEEISRKRKASAQQSTADEEEEESSESDASSGDDGEDAPTPRVSGVPPKKKQRVSDVDAMETDAPASEDGPKRREKRDRASKTAAHQPKESNRQKKQKNRKQSRIVTEGERAKGRAAGPEEAVVPQKDPSAATEKHSDVFNALMKGPLPPKEKKKNKRGGKSKSKT